MKDIAQLKRDIVFPAVLRGQELVFHSTWGLFSPRGIDAGTAMLIERMELGPADVTLDVGCGYGAIGIAAAVSCPAGRVHMVDKDFVALEFARRNAALNGVADRCEIYASNMLSNVPPDVRFDNIAANVPANVGAELLMILLSDARRQLRDGGRITIVCVAGLRRFFQRNLEEMFGNYQKLKQGGTYAVAMARR